MLKYKNADRRRQIAMFARGVNFADQFRQRYAFEMSNCFKLTPKNIFNANAGFVSIKHDGTLGTGDFIRPPLCLGLASGTPYYKWNRGRFHVAFTLRANDRAGHRICRCRNSARVTSHSFGAVQIGNKSLSRESFRNFLPFAPTYLEGRCEERPNSSATESFGSPLLSHLPFSDVARLDRARKSRPRQAGV
jgi:hypothetical protein